MQIKSQFAILIGLSSVLSCRCMLERQMPSPDISALKDDNNGILPLSGDYLPATMQAIHYYTEMMQYELVQNDLVTTQKPQTTSTHRRTTAKVPSTTPMTTKQITTTRRPTATSTVPRKTTKTTTMQNYMTTPTKTTTQKYPFSTAIDIWHNKEQTTAKPHRPGYFAPEKPPYWAYFGTLMKPGQGLHKPGIQQQPQVGIDALSDPNWKDPAFIQWFFQTRPKDVDEFDENELRLLDPLPKRLLLDLHRESTRLPALLDIDNVNEFRKLYDDSYYPRHRYQLPNIQQMRMNMKIQMQQQRVMLTGRKKPAPTRPYVHMLMLYDLLKREAKSKKLHQFGGFTPELLRQLDESSRHTGDYQMRFLLQKMVERKETTAADVKAKIDFILKDLDDEKNDTYKTLRLIPPLEFSP